VTAGVAVAAEEAVGENAAAKVGAELQLDVARDGSRVVVLGVREEGLEVVAHDAMEDRLGRAPWTVRRSEAGHARAMRRRAPGSMPSDFVQHLSRLQRNRILATQFNPKT
jgi:hypothetical protein